MRAFTQGYLDSLCGIYSIVNADKIVNNSTDEESLLLFNWIIEHLDEKGILKDIIIQGSDQKVMRELMRKVAKERIPYQLSDKKNLTNLKEWWKFSKDFLEEKSHRAILLSWGGRTNHLTVLERMTKRRLILRDSSDGIVSVNRSTCEFIGYTGTDKYIIYPSQCWYVGKE